MYSVYKHVNKINGKQYIGLTVQKPESRWGRDGINYSSSPHFWSAICKYGWDSFEHIVLFTGLSKEDASWAERTLIKEYKTDDNRYGYNIMEGGFAPSMPDSMKKKMSEIMKGNKNGLGKVCSEEKKRKISEAQKGRTLTEEHKEKLSKAKKGKPRGPCSEEVKRKTSNSHKKKRVYVLELDTVFPSIQECSRAVGVDASSICSCCKGNHKVIKGYHFSYYDNDNT